MMDIYREYMCDECMSLGGENSLSYDPKDKDFKCDKGHSESSEQIFRFDKTHDLILIIMDLLKKSNKKVNHIVPIGESDIEEFEKLLDNRRHPFTWTFGNCDLEFVSQWNLCADCVEEHPVKGSDLCKSCLDEPQIIGEEL